MEGAAEIQFAHLLANNEKETRDIGVKKLKKWFYAKSAGEKPFTEMELLRIWKGLFYCYWMSDKPLIQEELSERVASLIEFFATEEGSLLYIKTFFFTMLREWFGLDKWRMDKFMMLGRRFARATLKYNKDREWNTELATKIADIYKQDLWFFNAPNGLGFKLHLAQLFMEELAKVGGEGLSTEIIEIYMEPFYEVLTTDGKVNRLRTVVIKSVFEHLLRQSDVGIEYETGKDIEEMGEVVEVVKEEDLNDDEGIVIDKAEEMENEIEAKSTEAEPVMDPRAGNVSVEIPQLDVDYAKISKKLFELGSSNSTTIIQSCREEIYRLSESFKSVAEGVFPLTDEIADAEVEEINLEEEVAKYLKREEKILKKVEKETAEFEEVMKLRKEEERKAYEARMLEEAEYEGESEDENGVKRKMVDGDSEGDEDFDEPETKKAKTAKEIEERKESKKETKRKQKREQKRRKRERILAEELKKLEERRKSDLLLNKELEIQSTVSEHKIKKPKQKIEEVAATKVNTEVTNKKKENKKTDEKKVLEPELSKNKPEPMKSKVAAADSTTDDIETENVNKKKSKSVLEPEPVKDTVPEPIPQQNGESKKKKKDKKKRKSDEPLVEAVVEPSTEVNEVAKKKKKSEVEESVTEVVTESSTQQNEKAKKKKKDKPEEPVKVAAIEPSSQQNEKANKKKKKKDKEATVEKEINEGSSTEQSVSKKKKKKKDKKEALEKSKEVKEATQTLIGKKKKKNNFNVFEVPTDWDTPAQEGEQEIVVPSKKNKGDVKNKPESESVAPSSPPQKGFEDFSAPTITTPKMKSHTATFLKKAVSKSATPKKKLSQMEKIKFQVSSSDTKPKRVNWALTRNMFQGTEDLLASIKSSPGIPHDPAKQPDKGLLKRKSLSNTGSPALNPVALNTQLNAARHSKKGLKMQKRLSAQDFFQF